MLTEGILGSKISKDSSSQKLGVWEYWMTYGVLIGRLAGFWQKQGKLEASQVVQRCRKAPQFLNSSERGAGQSRQSGNAFSWSRKSWSYCIDLPHQSIAEASSFFHWSIEARNGPRRIDTGASKIPHWTRGWDRRVMVSLSLRHGSQAAVWPGGPGLGAAGHWAFRSCSR